MTWFDWAFRKMAEPEAVQKRVEKAAEKELEHRRMKFNAVFLEKLNAMGSIKSPNPRQPVYPVFPIKPYYPPKNVAPASHVIAMDDALTDCYQSSAVLFSGMGFPGFPYLTELTQITEYRDMYERVAAEMTRKWIKFRSVSDDDKSERIKEIEAEFKRLKVRENFRRAAEFDGSMGRCMIFIDLGDDGAHGSDELKTPLMLNEFKIRKDSLRGLKVVEPITTYPYQYNASNPLAQDYYQPSSWFVYGAQVHDSRMMTFVSRPLPNLIQPVYNFSGMSVSQLGQPYVEYWLKSRDSVGKLLTNFSTTVLSTNLQDIIANGEGSEVITRAKIFASFRDSQGLFMVNSDPANPEKLEQLNVPLSGLDKLLAQAQEHMAAVAKTPLAILLGISPAGLNPSAEGEIKIFYDYVSEQQEKIFRCNLEKLLKIVQLSLFGEIDDDITFDFVSLFALTGKEQALIRKSDSEVATALVALGAVSSEEVREKIASDPDSGYDNLNVEEPNGTLTKADPAAMKKLGAGQSSEEGATEGAEMNAADARAKMLMMDAIGMDVYHGNQHTGPVGASGEHPYLTATKMSGIARKVSNSANHVNTRSAHDRAIKAHQRALDAHTQALATCAPSAKEVHDAFIEAHQAAIEHHQGGTK